MDTPTFLHSIMTLITFITFIGIVIWAYSRKRKTEFEEAANAPFALPDDADGPGIGNGTGTGTGTGSRGGQPS